MCSTSSGQQNQEEEFASETPGGSQDSVPSLPASFRPRQARGKHCSPEIASLPTVTGNCSPTPESHPVTNTGSPHCPVTSLWGLLAAHIRKKGRSQRTSGSQDDSGPKGLQRFAPLWLFYLKHRESVYPICPPRQFNSWRSFFKE